MILTKCDSILILLHFLSLLFYHKQTRLELEKKLRFLAISLTFENLLKILDENDCIFMQNMLSLYKF